MNISQIIIFIAVELYEYKLYGNAYRCWGTSDNSNLGGCKRVVDDVCGGEAVRAVMCGVWETILFGFTMEIILASVTVMSPGGASNVQFTAHRTVRSGTDSY